MPFKESLVKTGLQRMITELQDIRDNHKVYPQRVSIPIHEEGSDAWLRISVEMEQYDEAEPDENTSDGQ